MVKLSTGLDDFPVAPADSGSSIPLDVHECGRVEVRPLREDDREQFLEAARGSASLTAPWSYVMCDDRDFWNILAQVDLGMETAFVSVDRDDRGIAGKFTVYNTLRGSSQSAMLGYNAFLPYAGTGRTLEAMLLIVDTCFAQAPYGLELHRLEINCEPENSRSIALARRLGFRHEGMSPRFQRLNGRWRDCAKFALTVEEWTPLRCCCR